MLGEKYPVSQNEAHPSDGLKSSVAPWDVFRNERKQHHLRDPMF